MESKKVLSAAIFGIDPYIVKIEVCIDERAFPAFDIVGLASREIAESKERIKAAIKSSGYKFPNKKIIVNLAPSDIRKTGSAFDLPIALGVLLASGQVGFDASKYIFAGELSLNGDLSMPENMFPYAFMAHENNLVLVSGKFDGASFKFFSDLRFLMCKNLKDAANFRNMYEAKPLASNSSAYNKFDDDVFKDIVGQEFAKRALQISAAGNHSIAILGPPGVGKSILIRAMPRLLPGINYKEFIEINKIYSSYSKSSGLSGGLVVSRPIRVPHHTISVAGMIGSGGLRRVRPGEIALSHGGILFLDEVFRFNKRVIDSLLIPLEQKSFSIVSAKEEHVFPCNFIFVIAGNLCPCGSLGDDSKECLCTESEIKNYRRNLSEPIADRIDLYVECAKVSCVSNSDGQDYKKSVDVAISMQKERYQAEKSIFRNSDLDEKSIEKFIKLDTESKNLLDDASKKMRLSLRAYHKVLKVSRTIADLCGDKEISSKHIGEALQYRSI